MISLGKSVVQAQVLPGWSATLDVQRVAFVA